MILKCGLNLNKKKPPKKPPSAQNIFSQLRPNDDSEHSVASQIATQSERQKQKAEQEKLRLLAEDPNVYAFDEVYDSMAEKKRGQIASKLNADAERKPKYFDKLVKRVEERKIEQGVIYQRGIVKERLAEDKMFSQTEAFITAGYKSQMIKDKAWQTQQDIVDRRNKGPTAAGMAGGFLSHLLNEPSSPIQLPESEQAINARPGNVSDVSRQKKEPLCFSEEEKKVCVKGTASETASHSEEPISIGVKRERPLKEEEQFQKELPYVLEPSDSLPVDGNPKTVKPSKEELAEAARERYLKRKAQKRNELATN